MFCVVFRVEPVVNEPCTTLLLPPPLPVWIDRIFPAKVVKPSDGEAVTPFVVKFDAIVSPNSVREPFKVDVSLTIVFTYWLMYDIACPIIVANSFPCFAESGVVVLVLVRLSTTSVVFK